MRHFENTQKCREGRSRACRRRHARLDDEKRRDPKNDMKNGILDDSLSERPRIAAKLREYGQKDRVTRRLGNAAPRLQHSERLALLGAGRPVARRLDQGAPHHPGDGDSPERMNDDRRRI